MRYTFLFYKQPFYKQLGLGGQKIKQLLKLKYIQATMFNQHKQLLRLSVSFC